MLAQTFDQLQVLVVDDASTDGSNVVCAPSVVMRREAVERLGGFDPRLPFTADWEMWLRMALFHDVGYLTHPLVHDRRHAQMETEQVPDSRQFEQSYLAKLLPLEKSPGHGPVVDALRARIAHEYRDRALARMGEELAAGHHARAGEYLAVALGVYLRGGPGTDGGDAAAVRRIFETLRAEDTVAAETRAADLARALEDRDRAIDAMTRTRTWRIGRAWWRLREAITGRPDPR